MSERIAALGRRAQDDPFFLAAALADYAQSEGLDEEGLAAMLNCSIETLNRLRLCRRPVPTADAYWADVTRIATRFGVKAEALAEVVRRSDVLVALRREGADGGGLVAAARDRVEETGSAASYGDEPPAGES
jgi:hypothetical protein